MTHVTLRDVSDLASHLDGASTCSNKRELQSWILALVPWGAEVLVRALVASTEHALVCLRAAPKQKLTKRDKRAIRDAKRCLKEGLEAARAWLACPCEQHAASSELTARALAELLPARGKPRGWQFAGLLAVRVAQAVVRAERSSPESLKQDLDWLCVKLDAQLLSPLGLAESVAGDLTAWAVGGEEPPVRDQLSEVGSNPQPRAKAAKFQATGLEARVRELIDQLRAEHYDVRWEAAEQLGQLGAVAEAAAPSLILALANGDGYEGDHEDPFRARAAQALGKILPSSQAAVYTLIEALEAPTGDVQAAAAAALGAFGPRALQAVPQLVGAVSSGYWDGREEVVLEAARALQRIRPPSSPSPRLAGLVERLGDRDPEVREDALLELGERGAKARSAASALLNCILNDSSRDVRQAAAEALGAVEASDRVRG